ncbi:TolC family outer membrane protein [Rhodobacteraceae bacterium ASV31]|nr:TolC family outer membrane protein [Anianabacter salinae]
MAAMMLSSGPARAESLADALVLAYRNSNLLEQNRALLRAADEDVATAVAQLRPVVAFIAGSTFTAIPGTAAPSTLTSTAQITAEITLFDFGRSQLAIDAAKETVLATRDGLLQVEQQVLLTAVQAYTDVLRASEFVQLRQNNVRLITEQLRAARDRFEVGEVTRTDVAIAESRLAAARSSLSAALGDLDIAREAYKAAVGQYPGTLRPPPSPPISASSEDQAKAIAERTHPSIAQAQHEVQASEFNILRAEAAKKPSITGNAGARVTSTGPANLTAGVQLNQTIYSGGSISAAIRQAAARRDASRASLHQTVLQVRQNVGNAWARLAVSQAVLAASDQQVRSSQLAYDGVREELRLGARTTLDVLNAEQELLDARTNRVSAEVDRYVAVYSLLSAMGLLTVDHLNLGIVTYDPAAYYNAVKNAPNGTVSPQGERLDSLMKRLGRN